MLSNPWSPASKNIKRALLDVYGQRCERLAVEAREDWTLPTLIRDLRQGDYLISFNYDRLAECLAELVGLVLEPASASRIVTQPLGASIPSDGCFKLAKPHGSVSWNLWDISDDPRRPAITDDELSAGQEPLLLGAIPTKSELLFETQASVPHVFHRVMQQWHVLCHAVLTCDTLVVAGYSFPKEDHHGRFLIEEAMRLRRRLQRRGPRVELFEHPDAVGAVARTVTELLTPSELVFCGPVEGATAGRS